MQSPSGVPMRTGVEKTGTVTVWNPSETTTPSEMMTRRGRLPCGGSAPMCPPCGGRNTCSNQWP